MSDYVDMLVNQKPKKPKKTDYVGMMTSKREPRQEPKLEPAVETSSDDFAPMPQDWNMGEYSSDPMTDRALAKRAWQGQQTSKSLGKDEIGYGSAALQTVGQGVGRAIDYTGSELAQTLQGVGKGVGAAYGAIPEPIKEVTAGVREESIDPIVGALGGVSEAAYDTDAVKAVRNLASESWDDVKEWWGSLDKNTRKNLESVGLIASVTPIKKSADLIHKGAITLKTSLRNQIVDKAFEQIAPFNSKKRLIEVYKRSNLKGNKGVYKPTPYEKAASETVADLKGFKYGKGGEYNGYIVNQARKDAIESLDRKLLSTNSPINRSVENDLRANIAALAKENPMFEAANTKPLKDRISESLRIIKRNSVNGKHTTQSLTKARRELDKLYDQKNAIDWTEREGTSLHTLNKTIRDTLNDLVDSHAPIDIKSERERLGHLIWASDNMAEKFAKGTKGLINQTMHVLSEIARTSWATKMITGVGVTSVAGAAASNPLQAAIVATLGGITYAGGKAVMSRPSRKAMLSLISELDKAGKVAKTVAEKTKIRKTRTAIAALVANSTIEQLDKDEEK